MGADALRHLILAAARSCHPPAAVNLLRIHLLPPYNLDHVLKTILPLRVVLQKHDPDLSQSTAGTLASDNCCISGPNPAPRINHGLQMHQPLILPPPWQKGQDLSLPCMRETCHVISAPCLLR